MNLINIIPVTHKHHVRARARAAQLFHRGIHVLSVSRYIMFARARQKFEGFPRYQNVPNISVARTSQSALAAILRRIQHALHIARASKLWPRRLKRYRFRRKPLRKPILPYVSFMLCRSPSPPRAPSQRDQTKRALSGQREDCPFTGARALQGERRRRRLARDANIDRRKHPETWRIPYNGSSRREQQPPQPR